MYPIEALADLLAGYSLDVRPGEVVVISGSVTSEPLLTAVFQKVLERGGRPVLRLVADVYRRTRLGLDSQEDAFLNPLNLDNGLPIDCSLGVWSSAPRTAEHATVSGRTLGPSGNVGEDVSEFLQAGARGPIRWVGTEFPTEQSAIDAGVSMDEFCTLLASATFLDRPNPAATWRQLGASQQRLCEFLERGRTMRIVAPGTDLTISIEGRRWLNDDGHFNLPGGEVLSAPVEGSASGHVEIHFPIDYQGHRLEGIRLTFRDGEVSDVSAECGEEKLVSMLAVDRGARLLGEVALGTNYALGRGLCNQLLDEKIGGTCHVALGQAYPATGGTNVSQLHVDLVVDLRNGGRCEVDGEVICTSGRFHRSGWPCPM